MATIIGVFAVLAVAGALVYKFVLTGHSSSAPTQSAPGAPPQSAPGAPLNATETKFVNDLAAVNVTSATGDPKALVADGWRVCHLLAGGERQDDVAADIVSTGNDQSSADRVVQAAIKDLCPNQH